MGLDFQEDIMGFDFQGNAVGFVQGRIKYNPAFLPIAALQ